MEYSVNQCGYGKRYKMTHDCVSMDKKKGVFMVELNNERMVQSAEFDLSLSDEEAKYFKKYALENIKKDENALISWAVNDILKNMVELLENKTEEKKGN